MVDRNKIIEALSTVYDPEVGIDIVNLGLVYNIDIKDDVVNVTMTLTVPGCPLATTITQDAKNAVSAVEGVREANVNLTFDPPWNVDMLSDAAKERLGYK
ncbi:MAG TPA: DUF59 domain-containing protein [Firmicutes bacterium]|uniref:MIP18 family-like domain-containing protein n=1 Tax=candidate division TA06 bacterium TaxID=2250710 RepID=A0A660S6X5_UNCT6|nr:DUF59 domain-containing protein [candidate division WOR-3 bacterium]RKX65678.1 MAG: hypothetical protein DRP44_05785 [candidate division TA06 bacterium]HFD04583.1 DUF59 domain-containing protein [Bacillota bacterium]